MNKVQSNNISLWEDITIKDKDYLELNEEIDVDVAIIGGGITGITAAFQLISAGKKVAIVEAHEIGSGTTGNSTGNLYVPIQPYYQKIESNFNFETAKAIAESRQKAIDYIEQIVNGNKILCNFNRRPFFYYAKQKKIDFLDKEVELLKKSGIDIHLAESLPLDIPHKKAAVIENQARFNPRQYVVSLAEILNQQGCKIFENSTVIDIVETKNKCIFKTKKGSIVAKKGIIATHTPTGINPIQFYTAAYRSYAVAVQLKNDIYPELHYWNLEDPHYAISTHSMASEKPDLLVIAGSHHKTGQDSKAETRFNKLEQYLEQHFQVKEIKYRWSAQHYHAADSLPYIGLASGFEHIYEATGFFADGLTYGTIAAVILSDSILNKKNELNNYYKVDRHTLIKSLPFLIKENVNVFLQYMKDMPRFSTKEYKNIKKNAAEVLVINGEKCGVYRDDNDKLHIVSAVCTHMKCIVNWNNAEKTWDCPCHGSRFTCEGVVIEGPARQNLEKKRIN